MESCRRLGLLELGRLLGNRELRPLIPLVPLLAENLVLAAKYTKFRMKRTVKNTRLPYRKNFSVSQP